jgi:predicted nucleotidyltransferase
MAQFGIDDQIWHEMNLIFKSFNNIEQVILYGSRAKGTFKPGSDIDLTLTGENISMADLKLLITRLDDMNMPYTIDLSIRKNLNHEELQKHIERVGKVIYQRT